MAHFSDLLRLELLCRYGGIWCDATVLCTGKDIPAEILDAPLFVYQITNGSQSCVEKPILASSWFIVAEPRQPILSLTREILYQYWKDNQVIGHYLLFHIVFTISCKRYIELWKQIPIYSNQPPHILQRELAEEYSSTRWEAIKRMSDFHKLTHHVEYDNTSNSFYNFLLKNDL